MLLPKSSQVFKLNKKSTFQVPTPVLTDSISIHLELHGKSLSPVGNFPRRVEIGESILQYEEFQVLSPVDGIAELQPNVKIQIRLDGRLNSPTEYNLREFSFHEICDKLKKLGVVSLDFNSTPSIYKMLQNFQDDKDAIIVFAPFTENNFIPFRNKIVERYKSELQTFIENLRKLFPKSKLYDFLVNLWEFKNYTYPHGNPYYFLNKYCNKPLHTPIPSNKILYLGPETVYHILQALYHSLPFTERLVSIHIINQNGFLEGENRVYKIKNGTNLNVFLSIIREKYGYKYFTVNSFFEKYPVYEIGAELIFDIYSYSSFIICESLVRDKRETICIDCNDCNYFCPVYANPRALLDKDKSFFLSKQCIECGLCSVFCPSHIDFSTRIKEFKQEEHKFAFS